MAGDHDADRSTIMRALVMAARTERTGGSAQSAMFRGRLSGRRAVPQLKPLMERRQSGRTR
jgi:hypothetical protein